MKKIIAQKNPIIPCMGVCDPHIHIFGDKMWMYTSHDASFENQHFAMHDWQIWSSEDCVEWTLESVIHPEDTFMGASDCCWAVDCAERNGKYYYYFSNGNRQTGVLVGDTPAGPFRDVLGKPLLDGTLTTTREYDPSIFCDDDGEYYIVFGGPKWCYGEGCGYYIARLNEDMISLAETPRYIELDHMGDDKASLNKFNGRYYLSYGGFYAMADNVYGPYRFVGHTGASNDHTSYCEWNSQLFNGITVEDGSKYFRSCGLCYTHIRENGELVVDPLIVEYGVGRYDSEWNRIEAEWYMKGTNVRKQENVGYHGFSVVCDKQATLIYPKVRNLSDKTAIEFVGMCNGRGGTIELRENDENGALLGSVQMNTRPVPYAWNKREKVAIRFKDKLPDETDIYIVLKPDSDSFITLDWFHFIKLPCRGISDKS